MSESRRPRRVKVQGDLYHGVVPEGAVYVGRAAPGLKKSPYANPFTSRQYSTDAVRLYAAYLDRHPALRKQAREELAGRDLACWCRLPGPDEPDLCHAAILLVLANPDLYAGGGQP